MAREIPSTKSMENAWAFQARKEWEEAKEKEAQKKEQEREKEISQAVSQIDEMYKILFGENSPKSAEDLAEFILTKSELENKKKHENPYASNTKEKFKNLAVSLMSLEEKNIGELNKIKENFFTKKFGKKNLKDIELEWDNFYFKLLKVYDELIKREEMALEEARKTVEKAFNGTNN